MDRRSTSRTPLVHIALALLFLAGAMPILPADAHHNPQQSGDLQCEATVWAAGQDPAQVPAKHHHDLVVSNITPSLDLAGGSKDHGRWSGQHWLAEDAGALNVTFTVKNVGNKTLIGQPTETDATVRIVRPDGTSAGVKTVQVATPDTRRTSTGQAVFSVGEGRYRIDVHVDPANKIDETCKDNAPTSSPGTRCEPVGTPAVCRYSYTHNNTLVRPIALGAFPDLVVATIDADAPVRATKAASPDSETEVRITVANQGDDVATSQDSATPGQVPFKLRVSVAGGKCTGGTASGDATLLDIDQVAAGGTKTLTANCQLHGLRETFTVEAEVDPNDKVTESVETNQVGNGTFAIPTPDIIVTYTTGLPVNDKGEHVLAEGQALYLNATVTNFGGGPAKSTDGAGFKVRMLQKGGVGTQAFYPKSGGSGTFTLDPYESVLVQGVAAAGDFNSATGTYTIFVRADEDDIVLEKDEDNEHEFVLRVASYKVNITAPSTTVVASPGAVGRAETTVKNEGTADDVIRMYTNGTESGVRFTDADGDPIETLTLGPGKSTKVYVERDIPRSAAKDTRIPTTIFARSESQGAESTDRLDLVYLVGEDAVAPTITLTSPKEATIGGRAGAWLSGQNLTFTVTDNVDVDKVESDHADGTFQTLQPMAGTNDTYRIHLSGQPADFEIALRASDLSGNVATKELRIVRDSTSPRITEWRFTPSQGLPPGQPVSLQVNAADDNLDTVTARITQARHYQPTDRPGESTCNPTAPTYDRTFTLRRQGSVYLLENWIVPERAGRYLFEVTATDLAGNSATAKDEDTRRGDVTHIYYHCIVYSSPGSDIEVVEAKPLLAPTKPEDGDPVRMTFTLRNTDPRFGTGTFQVLFVEDSRSIIGRQTLQLGPGETRPLTFDWVAKSGPHLLTLSVDSTDSVPESNEENNLQRLSTGTLFPGQKLFAAEATGPLSASFAERLETYWFVPVLLAANAVLFIVAIALGRKNGV
ncbi:MAG: hypothetical protein KY455_11775 [Euryarchaeota archaeon]|nr:hypothetical protein [Euryarchaeota archaeon]